MAIKINGVTVIDDDKNWTGNSIAGAAPTVCACKYCGVTSITPDLACANYYNIRANTSNLCICTLTNESSCASLYLDIISGSETKVNLPTCFYPSSFTADSTPERVYNYTKANSCWILNSVSCTRFIPGNNIFSPNPIQGSFNSECVPDFTLTATTGTITNTWLACCGCSTFIKQAICQSVPGYCFIQGADASKGSATTKFCNNWCALAGLCYVESFFGQMAGRSTVICTDYCQYPYGLYSYGDTCGCSLLCTGRFSFVAVYNITPKGIVVSNPKVLDFGPICADQQCWRWSAAVANPAIVSHSVRCNLILIHGKCERSDNGGSYINVYKLDCFLVKRQLCLLQNIYICPAAYNDFSGTEIRQFQIVKPNHSFDRCVGPALLTAGCCSYTMWLGNTAVCPICYSCSGSGLNYQQCLFAGPSTFNNETPINMSENGEYLLLLGHTSPTSALNQGRIRVMRWPNRANTSCCVSGSWSQIYAGTCTTTPAGFSSYGSPFATAMNVKTDKNLCHIFIFSECCGTTQLALTRCTDNTSYFVSAFARASCGTYFMAAGCSFGSEVIKCICLEQNCAYSGLACSTANGTSKGLIYNNTSCTWIVSNCCYGLANVCSQFCYNIEQYGYFRDPDGNLINPLILHGTCDCTLFSL